MKLLSALIFSNRWLQLPLYLGLILAQAVYVFHFWAELVALMEAVLGSTEALNKFVTSIGYQSDVQVTSLNETIIHAIFLLSALAIALTVRLMAHSAAASANH